MDNERLHDMYGDDTEEYFGNFIDQNNASCAADRLVNDGIMYDEVEFLCPACAKSYNLEDEKQKKDDDKDKKEGGKARKGGDRNRSKYGKVGRARSA
jgi:hypothetical protein